MRILGLNQSLRLANTDLERRVEERTAELQKALQAKSEFLSRASHELHAPMNHILGFAQLLASRKGLTEKQEASVRQILESGRRLLTLIDHILGFSKSGVSELGFEAIGPQDWAIAKSVKDLTDTDAASVEKHFRSRARLKRMLSYGSIDSR